MVRVGSTSTVKSKINNNGGRRKPSPRHFTFDTFHQHCGLFRRQADLVMTLLGVAILLLYALFFWVFGSSTQHHDPILLADTAKSKNLHSSSASTTLLRSSPFEGKQLPGPIELDEISKREFHEDEEDQGNGEEDDSRDPATKLTKDDHHNRTSATTPVVVAHVVSLIKCAKEASVTGFLDAAAVLRHSIHKTSVHTLDPTTQNPVSSYSYKMYAIVHAENNCAQHAPLLEGLGYTTLIRPTPVNRSDIINESYKHHVQNENCCGLDEFIKLYAYTLTDHPISVHWDMDVLVLQPLDDLYDSMLMEKESSKGQAARANIHLSYPRQPLPDRVDAFYTKDVTSSQPWELRQGVQGGFLVARPSKEIFNNYIDFITEGDFLQGRGNGFGWGGLGFGGFQGAMAYQGAVAYMYDILYPNHAVALNPCIYNQVVADVLWRGPKGMQHHLQCRQYPHKGYTFENNTIEYGACQDCRITPVAETKTAHYTACRKPWECIDPRPRNPKDKSQVYRLENLTNRTTCHLLFAEWFRVRHEFEQQLLQASSGTVQPVTPDGTFLPEAFLGYCRRRGKYIPMVPPPHGFDIRTIYGM